MQKLFLAAVALLGVMILAVSSPMAGPQNLDGGGVALQGYDPVAYFTEGKPVSGKPALSTRHDGATYYFANEANLNSFESDPAKYRPAYGGYCAYGMSEGYQAPIDPAAFSIVNDTLYLNYNKSVRSKWRDEQDERIVRADGHWKKMIQQ